MYSDTWPHKSSFWPVLFGESMQGRLGLFHFIQRITPTLRKNHVDYALASRKLLESVYSYHPKDYEDLLAALRAGRLGRKKFTSQDIEIMQRGKTFRQRYKKYLRKVIKPPETMIQCLDNWFCRFKVTASEGRPDPGRRPDPMTGQSLFTAETKEAVDNCKKKAEFIGDPLPIEKMYREVKANPNSGHKLSTWNSRRPESKLESFHDNLSHFANCGMRSTLCDSLNLCGTARYNLQIRHKIRLSQRSKEERNKMLVGWEEVVSYYNHSELAYVNALARDAGTDHVPFKDTEILVDDDGERFFSEYLNKNLPTPQQESDRYQCCKCATNEIPLLHENVVFSAKPPATTSPPPKAPPSPKQMEKRQSLPVDEPRWQSSNLCQQSVPEQPQQEWIVAKPPIEPNFIYVPHTTATMWQTNQMPLSGFQWMSPQPTHQQQAVCLPALPWMPPQPTQQQQEMCLLALPRMPPQPTQQQMYSAQTFTNGGFCCNKYFLWHINHNRKGRPPHEHQCLDRMQHKRDMHLGQETNSSI